MKAKCRKEKKGSKKNIGKNKVKKKEINVSQQMQNEAM